MSSSGKTKETAGIGFGLIYSTGSIIEVVSALFYTGFSGSGSMSISGTTMDGLGLRGRKFYISKLVLKVGEVGKQFGLSFVYC